MKLPFNIEKAAEAAHWLITRAGGRIDRLRLLNLLYLTDRRSLETRQVAIIGGNLCNLPKGPVNREVQELINESMTDDASPWSELINTRESHKIAVSGNITGYDNLASSEVRVLKSVWEHFGSMFGMELAEWIREHCREWTAPQDECVEIKATELAKAFGWDEQYSREFATGLDCQNYLHAIFSVCGYPEEIRGVEHASPIVERCLLHIQGGPTILEQWENALMLEGEAGVLRKMAGTLTPDIAREFSCVLPKSMLENFLGLGDAAKVTIVLGWLGDWEIQRFEAGPVYGATGTGFLESRGVHGVQTLKSLQAVLENPGASRLLADFVILASTIACQKLTAPSMPDCPGPETHDESHTHHHINEHH